MHVMREKTMRMKLFLLNSIRKNPLPLTNRAIENIIYKYTKSFDKRMSPHELRDTYATNLAEQFGYINSNKLKTLIHS